MRPRQLSETIGEVGQLRGVDDTRLRRGDVSVRAWRALRYNTAYATKVEKTKARKEAQKKAINPPKPAPTSNPFSVSFQ